MEPSENPVTAAGPVPPPAEGLAPPPAAEVPADANAVTVPDAQVNPDGKGKREKPASSFADPKCPAALAAFDQESVRLFNEHLVKVKEAEAEFNAANEEAKGKKKVWEAQNLGLHKLLEEREAQRGKPVQRSLFDTVQPQQPRADTLEAAAVVAEDPLENLWRAFPLTRTVQFGCRATDVQRLADGALKQGGEPHPCTTVGELADYTSGGQAGYERRIADFRGLGPAGCERIAEALTNFWGWWNGGGQAEYAQQQGVGRGPTQADQPGDGAGDPVVAGGEGDAGVPGAVEGAGAAGAGEAGGDPAVVTSPGDEPATVPEGGPEEYSLADEPAEGGGAGA